MNNISKHFNEESVIKLVTGEEIKGAKDVSDFVVTCCRSYNKGYMGALLKTFGYGMLGGVIVGGVHFGLKAINERKVKLEVVKKGEA